MKVSYLQTGLAGRSTFRWVAADLSLVLEEARRRLDLSPLSAVALGRLLTGAALVLRLSFKVPARLVLEVTGDGELGSVRAEVENDGGVRGTVANPRVETPEGGEMRIAEAIGRGFLKITRDSKGKRHTSQVALVSGELGDDLTHYLEQSMQIRSAVLLGVLPHSRGIRVAGGLVVEALPGTEDEDISRLESNIRAIEGVSRCLRVGGVPKLLAAVFAGFEPEILEQRPLEYRCRCDRDRLLAQLRGLSRDDRDYLVKEENTCEAVCSFCGTRYEFSALELAGAGTVD